MKHELDQLKLIPEDLSPFSLVIGSIAKVTYFVSCRQPLLLLLCFSGRIQPCVVHRANLGTKPGTSLTEDVRC